MSLVWVVEKETGAEWLTPYGWAADPTRALQFQAEADAQAYIAGRKVAAVAVRLDAQAPAEAAVRGTVSAEYDIFGYRAPG